MAQRVRSSVGLARDCTVEIPLWLIRRSLDTNATSSEPPEMTVKRTRAEVTRLLNRSANADASSYVRGALGGRTGVATPHENNSTTCLSTCRSQKKARSSTERPCRHLAGGSGANERSAKGTLSPLPPFASQMVRSVAATYDCARAPEHTHAMRHRPRFDGRSSQRSMRPFLRTTAGVVDQAGVHLP